MALSIINPAQQSAGTVVDTNPYARCIYTASLILIGWHVCVCVCVCVGVVIGVSDDSEQKSESAAVAAAATGSLSFSELSVFMTEFDLRRLESYARNLVDYHMILDLVPHVSFFRHISQSHPRLFLC